MQSPDHPDLVYLEALRTDGRPAYTVGRPSGPPLWVVIHDMEANERASCAEDTAMYFHTGAGGRSVSSHYTADDDSIVQCVLLQNSAWTVGNTQGNHRGINWELCGFASQSRAQWLDPFGRAMLARVAPYMISDMQRFKIPVHRCSVDDLRALRPGVTSHNDLRLAFGGTTHTDPGSNFPWDHLMSLLEGGMGTESPETRIHAFNADSYLYRLHTRDKEVPYVGVNDPLWTGATFDSLFIQAFDQLIADVAEIKAMLAAGGPPSTFIPHSHTTDEGTPT